MSDSAAVLRPWTVKAMPEVLTQRAAAAARRRQETVAELVTRALTRELDSPTQFAQIEPGKPTERSAQTEPSKPVLPELIQIATADGLPRYLRRGAARQIADRLGIVPPHLRLPALPAPERGGEGDQARASTDPASPAAAAPGDAGSAAGMAGSSGGDRPDAEQGERRSHDAGPRSQAQESPCG